MTTNDWRSYIRRSVVDREMVMALMEIQWDRGPEVWDRFQDLLIDLLEALVEQEPDFDPDRLIFNSRHLSDLAGYDVPFDRGVEHLEEVLSRVPGTIRE